jgi:hypothetical protein
LLTYQETWEHGHNFTEPLPELIEGQEEWEVEQILDKRVHRHKEQYLIKWKGYSDAHNSWEPMENIWAPVLILAFKNREGWKNNLKRGTRKKITTLCPRTHVGAKIKWIEVPEGREIIIKALHLGQTGEVRSKDKASFTTHNTPPPTLLPPFSLPQHRIALYYAMALALILTANNHPKVALPLIVITVVQHLLIKLKVFILAFDQ